MHQYSWLWAVLIRQKTYLSCRINVSFSIKLWLEVIKRFQLHREVKILGWPAYNPHFTPATYDHRYRQRAQYGITALCRIVLNGELDSFQNLCQLFDLNRQDFYRYLHVRHFFLKEIRGPNPEIPSRMIQIFIDAYKGVSTKGVIGKLYVAIIVMNKNSTDYVRQR